MNHLSLHLSPTDSPSLRRGDSAKEGGSSLMVSPALDRDSSMLSDMTVLSMDPEDSDDEDGAAAGPMQMASSGSEDEN